MTAWLQIFGPILAILFVIALGLGGCWWIFGKRVLFWAIFGVGSLLVCLALFFLWQGIGYSGSSSPSMGPGLGAAIAILLGLVLLLIGTIAAIYALSKLRVLKKIF